MIHNGSDNVQKIMAMHGEVSRRPAHVRGTFPLIVSQRDERIRSLSANGRFLNKTVLTSVYTVAFAPIPRVRARTATTLNPGFFDMERIPNRIS